MSDSEWTDADCAGFKTKCNNLSYILVIIINSVTSQMSRSDAFLWIIWGFIHSAIKINAVGVRAAEYIDSALISLCVFSQ